MLSCSMAQRWSYDLRLPILRNTGGGRKRPAEEGGPGGGSGSGDGGTLPDAKAVLRGQRWKLPRVRSLGSLPSDDALLAQAATWPGAPFSFGALSDTQRDAQSLQGVHVRL